jgi:hypothetical protein
MMTKLREFLHFISAVDFIPYKLLQDSNGLLSYRFSELTLDLTKTHTVILFCLFFLTYIPLNKINQTYVFPLCKIQQVSVGGCIDDDTLFNNLMHAETEKGKTCALP